MDPKRNHNALPLKWLLIAPAAGLLVAYAASAIVFDGGYADMLAGWFSATAINAISHQLLSKSIGQDTAVFMGMALGTIFFRLFGLIILVIIVLVGGFFWLGPFLTGLLSAYLSGVWADIYWLARSGISKPG